MRLWRYANLKGGKYLVETCQEGVLEVPSLVLGAPDPAAPAALRAYACSARQAQAEPGTVGAVQHRITRRDGSHPEWPSVVLRADDPHAPKALRAYAEEARAAGYDPDYVADLLRLAQEFDNYYDQMGPGESVVRAEEAAYVADSLLQQFDAWRARRGVGNPTAPPEWPEDPVTVARMAVGGSG